MTAIVADLSHALNRTVVIHASPDTVFTFFTNSVRWATWWGAGSTIDARQGGAVAIRFPDGTEVAGEVLEVRRPQRIVFTYGFVSGKLIAPGGSRVTIQLAPHAEGTRLDLVHQFPDAAARDVHVQGWRYQLSLFANVVADEVNIGAAKSVDGWFEAWAIADENERALLLGRIASPSVQFRDRFSQLDGLADLIPHITAAQRFMPAMRPERRGGIRHCQGHVLADWATAAVAGRPAMAGTNLFIFDASGRIVSVTGFWTANAQPSTSE